ncbi:hypothetical protein cypCar_00047145, partial [Cyprinus carpio]
MMDKSAAERACKDPNPIIDGRKANVNLAYLGAKPRSPLTELQFAMMFGCDIIRQRLIRNNNEFHYTTVQKRM